MGNWSTCNLWLRPFTWLSVRCKIRSTLLSRCSVYPSTLQSRQPPSSSSPMPVAMPSSACCKVFECFLSSVAFGALPSAHCREGTSGGLLNCPLKKGPRLLFCLKTPFLSFKALITICNCFLSLFSYCFPYSPYIDPRQRDKLRYVLLYPQHRVQAQSRCSKKNLSSIKSLCGGGISDSQELSFCF